MKRLRTCIGLAPLAVFVPQVTAQQARSQEAGLALRPIEASSIERISHEWSQLLLEGPQALWSALSIDPLNLAAIGPDGQVVDLGPTTES